MLADTLGCNVYHMPAGDIRGCTTREFQISEYWKVKSDVTFFVDEHTPELLSAVVRVRKNLWFYLVILSSGNRWMLFFDNDRAKIKIGSEREFCSGSSADALRRLKESALVAKEYVKGTHEWRLVGVPELLSGL